MLNKRTRATSNYRSETGFFLITYPNIEADGTRLLFHAISKLFLSLKVAKEALALAVS